MMRKLILMILLAASVAADADVPAPAGSAEPASTSVAKSSDAPAPAAADESAATAEAIAQLKTGTMNFDVTWGEVPLGQATITLRATREKGCYRYESVTVPVSVVRWLYGSPHELSLFCIRNGVIQPSYYKYSIEQRPNDSFSLDFDWQHKRVKTVKAGNISLRDLPDVAYDRFGLQQAIRLWVIQNANVSKPPVTEFVTVDANDINHYKFAILGHEKVITPVGTFDAIRVDRVDSATRSTRSWVAPSRDYDVIKVESLNRGKVQLRMVINK